MKKHPVGLQITGCLTMLFSLFVGAAHAGEAVDRLNAFIGSEGAIRGEFVQTVQDAAFSQPEKSRGTLAMQRGKFRWDYQSPYQQLIVADGKYLWIYDVDLEQVIVKELDEALGDTPALLLSGGSSLNERFNVEELFQPQEDLLWVRLLPREADPSFKELRFAFGPRHLARMELVDGFGQVTRLDFSNMERGVVLPADTFNFVPPEGVDLVGNPDVVTVQPLAPLD